MSKFAARVLSHGRSERARAALQVFAEKSPGFGSLTLWANQVDADPIRVCNAAPRAWTDGNTVYYTERFEKLPQLREKAGLVGHETWHIAFCHPQRAMKLAKENADFNSFLCNLAMDAIVNEGLKSPATPYDWIRMPDGSVELLDLLKEVLGEDWTREEALATWSVESLYRVLTDKTPRYPVPSPMGGDDGEKNKQALGGGGDTSPNPNFDSGNDATDNASGNDSQEQNAGTGKNKNTPSGHPDNDNVPHGDDSQGQDDGFDDRSQPGETDCDPSSNEKGGETEGTAAEPKLESNYDRTVRYAKQFGFTEDVDFNLGGNYDPEKIESDMRKWARRLEIARAGEATNGILRRIIADMPKSTTPWQSLVRSALMPSLIRRARKSWNVPMRQWLAVHRLPGYENFPYEPGNGKKRPAMRLVVCIDTSGSVSPELLTKFAGEIRSIQRLTDCEIYVIVGDCVVHGIWKLRPNDGDRNSLTSVDGTKVTFRGQGGTDFEPLLAAAADINPSAVVYLTDLQGPTGPKPRGFDVLWAVPKDMRAVTPTPDFGRVIEIQ